MKKINVAIDGEAGSGKSSVAKMVAKRLGYRYIDTGSMYRCVAYLIVKKHIDPESEIEVKNLLENSFSYQYNEGEVKLNDEDVTLSIRSNEVNEMLPRIVAKSYVRKFLVAKQQKMGENKGVVMDGRDIGSVVLKDAELKIYQVASVESRATRRYEENLKKGIKCSYNEILENLEKRDYIDKYVSKALVKVEDAIELDTTNMSFEEVCDYVYELVVKKVKE